MSRLSIFTKDGAEKTVESLYKDLERRITASQPAIPSLAGSVLRAGWDWDSCRP